MPDSPHIKKPTLSSAPLLKALSISLITHSIVEYFDSTHDLYRLLILCRESNDIISHHRSALQCVLRTALRTLWSDGCGAPIQNDECNDQSNVPKKVPDFSRLAVLHDDSNDLIPLHKMFRYVVYMESVIMAQEYLAHANLHEVSEFLAQLHPCPIEVKNCAFCINSHPVANHCVRLLEILLFNKMDGAKPEDSLFLLMNQFKSGSHQMWYGYAVSSRLPVMIPVEFFFKKTWDENPECYVQNMDATRKGSERETMVKSPPFLEHFNLVRKCLSEMFDECDMCVELMNVFSL